MILGLRSTQRHRLKSVPVVTLMPHSRCNCRCVMCDIWKANRAGVSLGEDAFARLVEDFDRLGVRWVVLSGGEALMHPNLWAFCAALEARRMRITLLTSGLLLARHAADVAAHCDEVIVSLDGPEPIHDAIRGIAGSFAAIVDGVAALRRIKPRYPVSGRCVVQRRNFRALPDVVRAARVMGLDRISFLAADVSTTAFNRPDAWPEARSTDVALSRAESAEFVDGVEAMIERCREQFRAHFIAEDPARMRRIAAYFQALHGDAPFPENSCNAPWVSTVVEADGTVRPCFFHAPIGNIHSGTLPEIVNAEHAIAFRRALDVRRDPVCQRCVCTLNL